MRHNLSYRDLLPLVPRGGAVPYEYETDVFAGAISATKTVEIRNLDEQGAKFAGSILLEVIGASTPNWTLAIQGKANSAGTYTAWDYVQVAVAGAAAISNATIAVNNTTRRFYLIVNPPPFIQLIATYTGGTLQVWARLLSFAPVYWPVTDASGNLMVNINSPAQTALADATANPTTNLFGAALEVFNGTTWDRVRSAGVLDGAASTGLLAASVYMFNGTTYDRLRSSPSDGSGNTGFLPVFPMAYNGATWDRVRNASGDGAAATGLTAAGLMGYNGTTWDRVRIAGSIGPLLVTASNTSAAPLADAYANPNETHVAADLFGYNGTTWDRVRLTGSVGPLQVSPSNAAAAALADATANPTTTQIASDMMVYNGTTWDRARSASADALAATGLVAAGLMGYNGATWDRVRLTGSAGPLQVSPSNAAAAALADATANPTTTHIAADQMVYNGSTWDRLRETTTANGLSITGIPMSAPMLFNGTTYDHVSSSLSDNVSQAGVLPALIVGINPSGNVDRLRDGLGDGAASTGLLDAGPMLYNGATFDRARTIEGTVNVGGTSGVQATGGATKLVSLTATSPAAASTVAQAAVTGLGSFRSMSVYAALTGATGGTLDVYLQYSPDGGTTWVDYAHWAQIAAGAAVIYRTFAVSKSGQQTTLQTVGTGTTPALAASTITGGDWGDRLRIVFVAGAGTSAGASQVILVTLTT